MALAVGPRARVVTAVKFISQALLVSLLVGCAGGSRPPADLPTVTDLPPQSASAQEFADWAWRWRTWRPEELQTEDAQRFAIDTDTPLLDARVKLLGPTVAEAQRSLAVKLWLIEHARHTIDLNYYIFKRDTVGLAVLGALCNAVQRGVDVRITVDSLGSISPGHTDLRALITCAEQAAPVLDADGQPTSRPARVQAVIFNALTRGNLNRRSHDKLMIADGLYPQRAVVITGGRNISFDYYGFKPDGSTDTNTFRDMEILLRPDPEAAIGSLHLGEIVSFYYTVLFDYRGNRYLDAAGNDDFDDESWLPTTDTAAELYRERRQAAQQALAEVQAFPRMQPLMAGMAAWLQADLRDSPVVLAHELDNLSNQNVVDAALSNKRSNPNSILNLLEEIRGGQRPGEVLTIVSPYLFLAQLKDADGNIIYDEVDGLLAWLADYPDTRLEIITNSVLTSDNFFTQSVIDMDTAPRLLLPVELQQAWLSGWDSGDLNPELVSSAHWQQLIANPQIRIYEAGGSDAVALGGSFPYGKMHAKFMLGANFGWVGTSNLDYRSRLLNNEMGFFFSADRLRDDLRQDTERLKQHALLWGTPAWLQLRQDVAAAGGIKGWTTRNQRFIYKALIALGLVWQF